VFSSIQFSKEIHSFLSILFFKALTVPILKDLDLTILSSIIIFNSVLPPPTSTYK
jgi:hypothetical protein